MKHTNPPNPAANANNPAALILRFSSWGVPRARFVSVFNLNATVLRAGRQASLRTQRGVRILGCMHALSYSQTLSASFITRLLTRNTYSRQSLKNTSPGSRTLNFHFFSLLVCVLPVCCLPCRRVQVALRKSKAALAALETKYEVCQVLMDTCWTKNCRRPRPCCVRHELSSLKTRESTKPRQYVFPCLIINTSRIAQGCI